MTRIVGGDGAFSPSRRQALLGGAAALGAAALPHAGCAAAPAGTPRSLVMLAANIAKSVGSVDYYVADAAGFFKEEELRIEVRYAANASQAAQILASGNADLGRFAFDPVLVGYSKGLRLEGFYQFYRQSIFYLGIPTDSKIRTVQDLRGKKVCVSNMGSAAVGVLRSMLKQAGVPAEQVTLIPISAPSAAIAARRSGAIDAYMLYNELYASLLGAGEQLRFIRDPAYGSVGGNAYFAQLESFATKPDALMRFARAIAKASVFILANFDAAAQIYLRANPDAGSAGTPADVAKIAMELRFWSIDWKLEGAGARFGEINLANLQRYAEALRGQGVLTAVPPLNDIVTNKLIDEANRFDVAAVQKAAKNWA